MPLSLLRPLVRAAFGLTAAALALCVAGSALADVDIEIAGKAKLKGSFDDLGGTQRVRFQATDGTKLKVVLKAKGKSSLEPGLRVMRGDQEVQLGDLLQDRGRTVLVKNPELGNTDLYTLEIDGDAAGDYLLKVVLKPAKQVKDTLQVGAQPAEVTLPVPSGSRLILLAKTSKKSGVTPRLLDLDGLDLSAVGSLAANKHKVVLDDVGAGGDLTLRVGSDDGTEGEVVLIVKIKPPKPAKGTIDVSERALGASTSQGVVFGKAIQADAGGTLVVPDDPLIGGAAIDVPADALPSTTVISIRSAPQIESDRPGANAATGPTVNFQPAGLRFQQDATITLPFDPSLVPEGVDPLTELRVLVVEADGTERLVSPSDVDLLGGTVELPVSGFTSFTVVAPVGRPDLEGRSYWGLICDVFHEPDLSGAQQSGTRSFLLGLTKFDFAPSGGMVDIFSDERELRFGLVNGPGTPLGIHDEQVFPGETGTGSWFIGTSGSSVFIDEGEGTEKYAVARGGAALMLPLSDFQTSDEAPILDLLLERPDAADVEDLLPGTYHFVDSTLFVPEPPVTGGFVSPELLRSFGRIVFRANGTASVTGDRREFVARQNGDVVDRSEAGEVFQEEATWTVDPSGDYPGSVLLSFGQQSSLRLLLDKTGQAFVGTQPTSGDPDFSYVIGARTSSNLSRNAVTGRYEFGAIGMELDTYTRANGPMTTEFADINTFAELGEFEFDGSSRVKVTTERGIEVFRDTAATNGVRIDAAVVETTRPKLTIRSDGSFTAVDGDPFVGAFTPNRILAFALPDPTKAGIGEFEFAILLRKPRSSEQAELPIDQ